MEQVPIDMLLFCPACSFQHIDAPEPENEWTNPPHKSHKCHNCGLIWRPADVPTNGVSIIKTRGDADTWHLEDLPEDECFCGDSRKDHSDGPCSFNGIGHHLPKEEPGNTCLRFRLFGRAGWRDRQTVPQP